MLNKNTELQYRIGKVSQVANLILPPLFLSLQHVTQKTLTYLCYMVKGQREYISNLAHMELLCPLRSFQFIQSHTCLQQRKNDQHQKSRTKLIIFNLLLITHFIFFFFYYFFWVQGMLREGGKGLRELIPGEERIANPKNKLTGESCYNGRG